MGRGLWGCGRVDAQEGVQGPVDHVVARRRRGMWRAWWETRGGKKKQRATYCGDDAADQPEQPDDCERAKFEEVVRCCGLGERSDPFEAVCEACCSVSLLDLGG